MKNLDVTKTYALAVSGGSDSMAMLDMFRRLSPAPKFFVVTVSHGIRKNGAADADFVQRYCAEVGVECLRFDVDAPSFAAEKKVSEETAGRLLRREIFQGLSCDFVCTAHNADDSAESILMHLLRGSGTEGALGIRRQSGKFLRPVLDFSKADLEKYCVQHGVPFVVDETNAQTEYTRNFLRNEVFPLLKRINSSATTNLLRFADNLADDDAYLSSLVDMDGVVASGGKITFSKQKLQQPRPIAVRTVKRAFALAGYPCDVEKSHIDSLIALANADGGKQVFLPFGLVAVNDYDKVSVFPAKNASFATASQLALREGTFDLPFGKVVLSQDPLPDCLRMDADKIPPEAVLRTPQSDDVFTKFGGGTKKLNRYFIDKKIPLRLRAFWPVVACGNEVLAVCGVEISEKVKIDSATDRVIYLSFTQEEKENGAH